MNDVCASLSVLPLSCPRLLLLLWSSSRFLTCCLPCLLGAAGGFLQSTWRTRRQIKILMEIPSILVFFYTESTILLQLKLALRGTFCIKRQQISTSSGAKPFFSCYSRFCVGFYFKVSMTSPISLIQMQVSMCMFKTP